MVSAEEAIQKALKPAAGAITLEEHDEGVLVGAASYRFTENGIKLVNIGSLKKGIGKKLFRRVLALSPDGKLWCQSDSGAVGFYEKMGMSRCESLPDGRVIFRIGF